MANTNTNIFGLTFFGKYEYKYFWITFFGQRQIYSGLPKMGEYEFEYEFFGLIFANTNTNIITLKIEF